MKKFDSIMEAQLHIFQRTYGAKRIVFSHQYIDGCHITNVYGASDAIKRITDGHWFSITYSNRHGRYVEYFVFKDGNIYWQCKDFGYKKQTDKEVENFLFNNSIN